MDTEMNMLNIIKFNIKEKIIHLIGFIIIIEKQIKLYDNQQLIF
jgi:hypothetical protein